MTSIIRWFQRDWFKIPLLGDTKTAIKLGIRSWFGDLGFSISDFILALLSCFQHSLSQFHSFKENSYEYAIWTSCEGTREKGLWVRVGKEAVENDALYQGRTEPLLSIYFVPGTVLWSFKFSKSNYYIHSKIIPILQVKKQRQKLNPGHVDPTRTSLVAQLVKNPPAIWKTWVQSLSWEDPLEKGKATHSSILAWRIPWTV